MGGVTTGPKDRALKRLLSENNKAMERIAAKTGEPELQLTLDPVATMGLGMYLVRAATGDGSWGCLRRIEEDIKVTPLYWLR